MKTPLPNGASCRTAQLIQDGSCLAYVKDQMGHRAIQITVDSYGHLIPGATINWVDGLDRKTTPQQNATPAQLETEETEEVNAWSSELIVTRRILVGPVGLEPTTNRL